MTATLPSEFSIQDDFPPVPYDQWREVVDQMLAGAPFEKRLVSQTYDGIGIQPIYSRRDDSGGEDPFGFPGLADRTRGSRPLGSVQTGWDLRQEINDPRRTVSNEAILVDLKGGVTSVHLRLDRAARCGLDPDASGGASWVGRDGVMVYCVDDLDALLAGVQLDLIAVSLEAGAAFVPAASLLAGLWQRRGVESPLAKGAFNADPLAELARRGQLPMSAESALSQLSDLARWTSQNYPNVTAVGVDASPYHDAGATAAQDIAMSLATGVEYLRAMTAAGMEVDAAAAQIQFQMSLGTQHFLAIAKLRAARWLWARVLEACGGSEASRGMRIHARMGNRVLTQHDPYVNVLRNSVAVFAAGIGGADVITSVPFDAAVGLPNVLSRRIARNTALVLQDESHLHRVIDPAGGSWFLDQLTEDLADKAWETFQETERQGGMLAALNSQWVAKQIDAASVARSKDIARRKRGITGVSEFPNVSEEPVVHDPPDTDALAEEAVTKIRQTRQASNDDLSLSAADDSMAAAVMSASSGATLGQLAAALGFHGGATASMTAIEPRRLAEPFDELRDASDAWLSVHGHRPAVFLANIGPVSHYSARATWSTNFLEAGGFEVIGSLGFEDADAAVVAFQDSQAKIAVICSSDKLYPDIVPSAAAKLKQAGARSVALAGNPGDNEQTWRDAGVDRFIFMRCDVLETLRALLTEVGVLKEGETTQ